MKINLHSVAVLTISLAITICKANEEHHSSSRVLQGKFIYSCLCASSWFQVGGKAVIKRERCNCSDLLWATCLFTGQIFSAQSETVDPLLVYDFLTNDATGARFIVSILFQVNTTLVLLDIYFYWKCWTFWFHLSCFELELGSLFVQTDICRIKPLQVT